MHRFVLDECKDARAVNTLAEKHRARHQEEHPEDGCVQETEEPEDRVQQVAPEEHLSTKQNNTTAFNGLCRLRVNDYKHIDACKVTAKICSKTCAPAKRKSMSYNCIFDYLC